MLGRALLTVVGLIIAAGLMLPFYPQSAQPPSALPAPEALALLAAPEGGGCEDCLIEGVDSSACRSDCRCGERLAATFVLDVDPPARLTLAVTVRVLPAETTRLPKLPAI